MAITGISIKPDLLAQVDALARRRKLSRSRLIVEMLERELVRARDGSALDVRIDGVVYRPMRAAKRKSGG